MAKPPVSTITCSCLALGLLACGDDERPALTGVTAGSIELPQGSTGDREDPEPPSLEPTTTLSVPQTEGFEDVPDQSEECAVFTQTAENTRLPVDIVVVVDNSGSMEVEATAVQDNLNRFSEQIIDSGIDVRVVVLSAYPGQEEDDDGGWGGGGGRGGTYGMCIEPPLGSGGCPETDDNPPLFTHIDQEIDSHDALEQILAHRQDWSAVLRPDAALHFMVVTDDESELEADAFDEALRADHPDYELHGIVCMRECEEAAAIGETYIDLGERTGGLVRDLCDQDFQPVFDLLATEVVAGAQIQCDWAVPSPPEGEAFRPDQVTVDYDDGAGGGFTIGRVEDPADCAQVEDGWHYDDPAAPTRIVACPATCDRMQGSEVASIAITLTCEPVPPLPVG